MRVKGLDARKKVFFSPRAPLFFQKKRGILLLGETSRILRCLTPYPSVLIRTHPYKRAAPQRQHTAAVIQNTCFTSSTHQQFNQCKKLFK